MSNNLYEQKWQKFLRRVWLFKFIPFVDFVLAAGSLVTGNMREESDFDVIIGVKQGRIFTVRAFCILAFGMFGWRAEHPNLFQSSPLQYYVVLKWRQALKWRHPSQDKICFNHFVTPAAYRLSPPHNEYWQNLYKNLVPVYGSPEVIQKFYDANSDWLQERRIYKSDQRHIYKEKGLFKKFLEWRWFGIWANWLEKFLKAIQVAKIESNLKEQSGYKPRIIFNDDELEFHPDTKRIADLVK